MSHIEPLLIAVKESSTSPGSDKSMKSIEFKKLKQKERINKWNDKKIHGQYLGEVNAKRDNSTRR